MIRINLLPFRTAKRLENIRMQISIYLLTLILVVAVLAWNFIRLNSALGEVRTKNAQLKKELASYSVLLKRVDELKKNRKDLQNKLEVIQGLEAKKAGPVQLFDEISMAVPVGRLFLKSLSETDKEVRMSGIAKDYDTVALFMTRLENTKTIQSVTLGSTKKTEVEDQVVNDFSLTCTKAGPEEEPEVKKGKRGSGKRKRR